MSVRRVGILLGKEFSRGPRDFIFIFAIVAPLFISLVMTLVFGELFAEEPGLGILDRASSRVSDLAMQSPSVDGRRFDSVDSLKDAVESGTVDMGVVLPAGIDEMLRRGERTEVTAYVWGESLARNRTILTTVVDDIMREVAGHEAPVEIVTATLGDTESIPWNDRVLPLVVLMAVIFGGSMVPATSLVDERQKRTLTALVVTPTTLEDVFLAKGLLGVIISVVMGVLILAINQAFGTQPLMLLTVLAMGAVLAAEFGILLGTRMKDITTLFATVKAIGIFLYAPAIVYLFPQVPRWVGRIFPTYYIVQPVVEISQQGGRWPDIALELSILAGLITLLLVFLILNARRLKQQEA